MYSLVGIVDVKLSYHVIQLGFFYSAKHSECPKFQKRRKNVSVSITPLTRTGGRKYYVKLFACRIDLHVASKSEAIYKSIQARAMISKGYVYIQKLTTIF